MPLISFESENLFKSAPNVLYTFFINLVNPVSGTGKFTIEFSNAWTLAQTECSIIDGVPSIDDFNKPRCQIESSTNYLISNFKELNSSKRVIISIRLNTPTL